VAISETKLKVGAFTRNIDLDGYNFVHTDSKTCAGGVGLYIKDTLKYSVNQCSNHRLTYAGHLWVDIQADKGPMTIGVVYKHLEDTATGIDNFSEEINELLLTLNSSIFSLILCCRFQHKFTKNM